MARTRARSRGGPVGRSAGNAAGPYPFNSAMVFNGTTAYAEVNDSASLSPTDNMSVCFWFLDASAAAVIEKTPICKWDFQTDGCWWIENYTNRSLIFAIAPTANDGITAYGLSDAEAFVKGSWTHCAMVYDKNGATNADKLKVYINGALINLTFTGTIPSALLNSGGKLRIGHWLEGGSRARFWNGRLDDIKFHNVSLTAAEVLGTYRRLLVSRGLVSHWKMDEGSGVVLVDAKGVNNGDCANVTWAAHT